RLSNILLKLDILAPQNNIDLPFSSTMIPIQQLSHIMENAHTYNCEFWILLQDMSKAYDTVGGDLEESVRGGH
ncbi:13241_t:CDS:2, partial [Gigaspora rosea]